MSPKARKDLRRIAGSILFALFGLTLVLSLVVLMNAQNQPPAEKEKTSRELIAQKTKKKPPKKMKKRERPKRKRHTARKQAPAPKLSTAISGVSFGLPGLSGLDMGDAADRMVGDEGTKNLVMTAATVDVPPKPVERGRITYPSWARAKNIEGYVVLSLLINASGQVEKVKVLEAEPKDVFEQVVIEAARTWRFEPAMYRGKSVAMRATQKIPFKLGG